MIGDLIGFLIDRALFIAQTAQILSLHRVSRLCSSGIIFRGDQSRSYSCREIFENEPADRFCGMDKGLQCCTVIPCCLTKGIVQVKVHIGRRSQFFQGEFERGTRYLRRCRLLIIRMIVFLLNGKIILFLYLFADPRETVVRARDTIHRAKIPEIRPIQRQAQGRIALPDQCTDSCVTKGHSFIPGGCQVGELQITFGRCNRQVTFPSSATGYQ